MLQLKLSQGETERERDREGEREVGEERWGATLSRQMNVKHARGCGNVYAAVDEL